MVFDKTGTLTTGLPVIVGTAINPDRKGFDKTGALRIAALLEVDSSHPVARAFADITVSRDEVADIVNHDNGVEGRVGDSLYRLGNAAFSQVNVVDLPSAGGKTVAR